MKSYILILLATITLTGFDKERVIPACYLSFKGTKTFKAESPDRLPIRSDNSRTVKTETGEAFVPRLDGYRILYTDNTGNAFVNLKIELSDPAHYVNNKRQLLKNLEYQIANSREMKADSLLEFEIDGYKLYGFDRSELDLGSTMSLYILFLEENSIVYFYFNNMEVGKRKFETIEEYMTMRTEFIEEYTEYISSCKSE